MKLTTIMRIFLLLTILIAVLYLRMEIISKNKTNAPPINGGEVVIELFDNK